VTTAYYRLLTPAGQASEEGSGDVVVGGGAFVLTPKAGDVLRVPFGQIASAGPGEQFTIRIALTQGTVVELSRMGTMRTQLLAELRDGLGDTAASSAAVVGKADTFSAVSGGAPVEVRVYDDALLIVGTSGAERVSFSFVREVTTANYIVTITVTAREAIELSRLGNRTGEFSSALSDRLSAARCRTSAFLCALLPGLDPMQLRPAAGLLRDGVAVPAAALNGIHPELADTLIALSALPDRHGCVTELSRLAAIWIGFRQVGSVHKDAEGVTPWLDHSVTPHIGQHESQGGSFQKGFGGMLAAGLMSGLGPGGGLGGGGFGPGGLGTIASGGPFGFGEGYGDFGSYWAYRALGAGINGPQQHQMTQRPDMTRGRLTPATEDLAALTTSGDSPTVLAFVLAAAGDLVVFEILNLPEPPTLVFRAAGPDGLAAVNRALVDSGFTQPPPGSGLGAPARAAGQAGALADLLAGQVAHDGQWSSRLTALLSGRNP